MLDPMFYRGCDFRPGVSVHLADGQVWMLPEPAFAVDPCHVYRALLTSLITAEDRFELLRAELALGIYLIITNYDLPPLSLGALLDFSQDDPELTRLHAVLHAVALDHLRAHRSLIDVSIVPLTVSKMVHRSKLFDRVRAAMTELWPPWRRPRRSFEIVLLGQHSQADQRR